MSQLAASAPQPLSEADSGSPSSHQASFEEASVSPRRGLTPGGAGFTAMALMCTLLWAGAQIAAKAGLSYCPPMALMSLRFLIAGTLLQGVCYVVKSPWPSSLAGLGRLIFLGILNNTLYLGITAIGLTGVSAGLNCVLTGTNPLLLAIGGWLMFGEAVSVGTFVGLLGAQAGVIWVMAGRLGADNRPSGIALILLANCTMVAGNLFYKRWQSESGLVRSHSVQLLIGGITLGLLSCCYEDLGSIQPVWQLGASIGFLVFGVSFGAMLSWLYMLARGDAGRAGAFLFLVPLFGLGLGALFLGEPVGLSDLLGATLATLCVGWVQRPKKALASSGI